MEIKHNFNLQDYNSFRIKACCKKAYFPNSIDDLKQIYSEPTTLERIIIGEGNNIIFKDEVYQNEFVIFNGTFNEINFLTDDTIKCGAGVSLKKLSECALEASLSGLEIFYDIPSSLGGAVVMNAGAYGIDIKDFIVDVTCLNKNTLEVSNYRVNDLKYTYRTSIFQNQKELIITHVTLKLSPGEKHEIYKKMMDTKENRWQKQPRDYPNAGSVFKRPQGFYVGKIIQDLGLKGYKIGGAQISQKHGGFIINVDNAKGKDIIALIDHIQEEVNSAYGFKLEVEQRII